MSPIHLPNLFLPGPAKCASNFLHYLLGMHPDIFAPEIKELNWLAARIEKNNPLEYLEAKYLSRYAGEAFILDAAPGMLRYSKLLTEYVRQDTQFIFVIRHPVKRAFSAYWQDVIDYKAHGSFEQSFYANEGIKRDSHILKHLKDLVANVGRNRILFLSFEEDISTLGEPDIMDKIADFLGIQLGLFTKQRNQIKNPTSRRGFSLIPLTDLMEKHEAAARSLGADEIYKRHPDALVEYHSFTDIAERVFLQPSEAIRTYAEVLRNFVTHTLQPDQIEDMYVAYFRDEYERVADLIGDHTMKFRY